MHRAGIFRSSVLVGIVNGAGVPLLGVYALAMFIFPWFGGHGSWEHVQAVWDRWQTLNAGALAFLASLVAFNISRFNEHRQRERDFVAAKAFLPSTLSALMKYCSESSTIYRALWTLDAHANGTIAVPELPRDYREVFSSCIRYADPSVGDYLSTILVNLQVHDSRLQEAVEQGADRYSLVAYLFRLGELHALMGKLFGFARSEEEFSSVPLGWDDFRGSFLNLDIDVEDIFIDEKMNLRAFTERRIERHKSKIGTGG